MGQETGTVVKVNKNKIVVKLSAGDHCNVCAAKSMCAFQSSDSSVRLLELPKRSNIPEGAQVRLEYKESSRILAAFIVFLLPLLFLLAGYYVGESLLTGPNGGVIGAVVGFFLAGIVLYWLNRWLSHSKYFLPRLVGLQSPGREFPSSGKKAH